MSSPIIKTLPSVPVLQSDTFEIQRQKINNVTTDFLAAIPYVLRSTISLNTSTTQPSFVITHGQGIVPVNVRLVAQCVIGVAGYNTNDEVDLWTTPDGSGDDSLGVVSTASTVSILFGPNGGGWEIRQKDGTGIIQITGPTYGVNWNLRTYITFVAASQITSI